TIDEGAAIGVGGALQQHVAAGVAHAIVAGVVAAVAGKADAALAQARVERRRLGEAAILVGRVSDALRVDPGHTASRRWQLAGACGPEPAREDAHLVRPLDAVAQLAI